jgi:hypothetical protein
MIEKVPQMNIVQVINNAKVIIQCYNFSHYYCVGMTQGVFLSKLKNEHLVKEGKDCLIFVVVLSKISCPN